MTPQAPLASPESRPIERLTYSVDESAQALGVSRPTIYRLLARRVLVPVAGLRHKRIPCQQIRRLVNSTELHNRN
ncbi:MAG: helix-turn-helix domain-containing protein [Opitutaceae bacterium]|nr:helix-turn-helix domain-containing protein [Opitutaceae bacterium]